MAESSSDARHTWLEDWVCLKLGIKAEKFRKLISNPDDSAAVSSFLDSAEVMSVYFSMTPNGKDLAASQQLPTKLKKAIYRLAVEKYNKQVDHQGL